MKKNSTHAAYVKRYYNLNCDMLCKTKDMDRAEWLEQRKKGVTGTDVSSIVGVNNWSSSTAVYLKKLGELGETDENEFMYWGTIMEPIIAKEFSKRNENMKVKSANAILMHPENNWALANIDRLIKDENGNMGILEIKTASEHSKKMWEADEVPVSYLIQIQWYMYVTGTNYGYFAALLGGNHYIQKRVERDDELIEMLVDASSDFWNNNVLKRVAPPVDAKSSEVLAKLNPQSNGESIELKEGSIDTINNLDRIKDELNRLEIEKRIEENKLKEELGENEIGVAGDRKVVWKTIERNSVDSKRLKEEQPEIYEKYLKTTSYRKFDIR